MAIRLLVIGVGFLCILSVVGPIGLASAEEYLLPPIVKDASPVDALSVDSIVPTAKVKTSVSSGSGSVQQTMEEDLPYSVTDPGRPGSLTQFRGLGRSAEDTNVQALGIPLNYPQGGGFDFSSFPQFFWNDYQFALSPSTGALDPRGVSGTLSLDPWTARALTDSEIKSRWTALYAGKDLQQISVGAKYHDQVAVLAGESNGLIKGPTGSVSARLVNTDQVELNLHLLATDVDSTLYNFGYGASPDQVTLRVIPALQLNWTPRPNALVKSSVFYDNTYIRYDDPNDSSNDTRDRAQQWGIENAVFLGDWKFGLGSRSVDYAQIGFNAPTETVTSALVSRTLSWETSQQSHLLLDPSIQGVYVSHFATNPQGSFGIREQWIDHAVFFRGSYSRRFPSLTDRYYSVASIFGFPAIQGNPGLAPEDDFTYVAGIEGSSGGLSGSIQGYYQVRNNAEVPVTQNNVTSQQNFGQARVASLIASGTAKIAQRVKLMESINFTHSRVDALETSFPYIPNLVNVFGVEMEPTAGFILSMAMRAQTDAFVSASTGSLPGTAFADVQASYVFKTGIQVIGRAENVTGDSLVLAQGYPGKGRVFTLSVVGPL